MKDFTAYCCQLSTTTCIFSIFPCMCTHLLSWQSCYQLSKCLKAFAVEWWSIPSINTLYRPVIDTPSTLHQHLSWHLIDTPSTSRLTVGQESTNFWSIHMSWPSVGQLSTDCWSIRVSTEYRSNVDRVLIMISIEGINALSTHDPIILTLHCILYHCFMHETCMYQHVHIFLNI